MFPPTIVQTCIVHLIRNSMDFASLKRRLEFHYTPKHASWLNMVEIEIGVLKGQCLDRRIESCGRLVAEIDV